MFLDGIAKRIRSRREERGFKQADIANALQVSAQAVSKWERGENAPDIALLGGLAKLLGVSTDWILGLHEETADVFEATVFVSAVQGLCKKGEPKPAQGDGDLGQPLFLSPHRGDSKKRWCADKTGG